MPDTSTPPNPGPSGGLALRRLQAQLDRMDARVDAQITRRERSAGDAARLGETVAAIVSTSAAVSEAVLGDEPAGAPYLAFTTLVGLSLGHLGVGVASGRMDVARAMVANLRSLCDALPSGTLRVDTGAWREALAAFPAGPPPEPRPEPHPRSTVYSPLVAQVRDRGLTLEGFRQVLLPAGDDLALHVVR